MVAPISGRSHLAVATVTTTTGTYASNDVVGGTVTFSNMGYGHSRGIIVTANVTTLSGGSLPLTLNFFRATPTTAANDAAGSFAVTDITTNFIGRLQVLAADYTLAGTAATPPCVASVGSQFLPYVMGNSDTLYCVPIARAAHTFTGTVDLVIGLGVLQD